MTPTIYRNITLTGFDMRYSASFAYPLDVTWHGAVAALNNEPLYSTSGNIGLWIIVEYPPTVTID